MLCAVRGFVTGSTETSLWTVYKNGVRNYCGNVLPNGEASVWLNPSSLGNCAI